MKLPPDEQRDFLRRYIITAIQTPTVHHVSPQILLSAAAPAK
jgi:hypothetical protein